MYNKSLDIFKVVAETSSFSKAAEKLFISHTAVIKQMNQLEQYLGVKLINRTNHGTSLTSSGQVLYEETLSLIKTFDTIIQKVQKAHFSSPETLRVGASILYPCNDFMNLWDSISQKYPQFQLKIVSFEDDEKRFRFLNDSYDFLIGAFNNSFDNERLQFYPIGTYCFSLAIPRKHPLAKKKRLSLADLNNEQIMIMNTGVSPINDQIRQDIQDMNLNIEIIDILSSYNLATFNNAVEQDKILLSLDCWKNVHPALTTVALKEEYKMPYGIILPKNTTGHLDMFVTALQNTVGSSYHTT